MSGHAGHAVATTSRCLLLLTLAALGLACSRSGGHEETLAKLEELERRLEEGRELEGRLPALETEIVEVDSQVADLGVVLVRDEADALVRLRAALEHAGFGVVDLRSRGSELVESVTVLRVEVEAVTAFETATSAFEALEREPLIVLVEDLSLRRDGELARLRFTARLGLVPQAG